MIIPARRDLKIQPLTFRVPENAPISLTNHLCPSFSPLIPQRRHHQHSPATTWTRNATFGPFANEKFLLLPPRPSIGSGICWPHTHLPASPRLSLCGRWQQLSGKFYFGFDIKGTIFNLRQRRTAPPFPVTNLCARFCSTRQNNLSRVTHGLVLCRSTIY